MCVAAGRVEAGSCPGGGGVEVALPGVRVTSIPCGGGIGVEPGERRRGTSVFCGVCPGTSAGIITGEPCASGIIGVVAIGGVCDRGDTGGAMT